MSSNIPTRRVTRATRLPNENAVGGVARPGKPASRDSTAGPSKPPSTTAAPGGLQHKRKREALGEVTNNRKQSLNMARGATFGPMKQTGTLIVNDAPPRVIKAPAKLPVRKPRTQTQVKVENRSEDAMAIDEPSGRTTLHRVARKTTSGTLGRIPIVTEEVIPDIKAEEEDDEPAHKKRRTSSEGDVEATVETYEEPIPADAVAKVEPKEEEDEVLAEGPVLKTEKAEATGWEDLDRNDFDDPNMVSEYVNDIFEYLAECEIETLPNANYMSHQKELKWSHRTLLMDFLIAMQRQLRLLPETLHLAVNIIDRFLSLRVVSLSKLQLVGLACFMIATKFEEIAAPSVKHWLHAGMMIDDATEEEMLKAEKYILKTLNWNISTFPQPMNWIRRVSKADDYDAEVRLISKFFLDLHVIDRKLLGVKPSLIAAASMWCARVIMGKFGWGPTFVHYSGYTEAEILPIANIMLNYCLREEKAENLMAKYSTKRYGKVAVYVNGWVGSRWTMGDKINLEHELPYIVALGQGENEEE